MSAEEIAKESIKDGFYNYEENRCGGTDYRLGVLDGIISLSVKIGVKKSEVNEIQKHVYETYYPEKQFEEYFLEKEP